VSQFEYIVVLISIVSGLGIVHLLRGIASFLTERDRLKPYWLHLLWTWNVFQFLVFFWWFVWRWSQVAEWQLLLFFFILIYATVLYLLCAVLYPPVSSSSKVDFRNVYYENRAVFFLLWVAAMLIDIVDTQWKISMGREPIGILHLLIWISTIGSSLIAAKVRHPVFHAAWGLVFLALMTYVELAQFAVLRAD
jgi:hypothetical protein